MKRLVWIGVLIAVILGVKLSNMSEADAEVLADMKLLLEDLGLTEQDLAFATESLERVHDSAFNAAYDMGGRRRSATLDEDKYITQVFDKMIADCNRAKKEELADTLAKAKILLLEQG